MRSIFRSDEELAKLSAAGDRDAFALLYDRYFDKLYVFARGFLKNDHAAQDAVQEIFYRFMQRAALFDHEKNFSAWIYQVTRNKCLNVIRDEQNRLRLRNALKHTMTGQSQMHNNIDYHLILEKVHTTIDSLSDRERRIYKLRFQEEKSVREISDATGSPQGTIKSAIFYILKKISASLKEYIHE